MCVVRAVSYSVSASRYKAGLSYVLHKLLANWSDIFAEGGAEHHNLLLMWRGSENFLYISSHVKLLQHFVAFIQNKVLQILERKFLTP